MLIGYLTTVAVLATFLALVVSIIKGRKELYDELKKSINKYSLTFLAVILIFFVFFSLLFVHPAEQLYFDENIYQGIAINILRHGNALWCQFGSGYLQNCYVNALYHDPAGWSVFIAMAFMIFGIGVGTAYSFQLFVGALSIIAVFLLSSALFERKSVAVLSTLALALMPELFIWSRTQADIDLPLMMLSTFAFFFFVLFTKRKTRNTLAMFSFSLLLAVYVRMEGILLLPIFAILMFTLGNNGVVETIKERARAIYRTMEKDFVSLMLLLAFLVLLLPQIYYITIQARNPSYGQSEGQGVISLANFNVNIHTNLNFIFGQLNAISYYPAAFPITAVPLAIFGAVIFALLGRNKNRFGILLLLGLWFASYFLFYTFFYAGSATFGVDVRFMLQIMPTVSMLAALAICGVADAASGMKNKGGGKRRLVAFYAIIFILTAALVIWPFAGLTPNITIAPQKMPQQSVIFKVMNFFYGNYSTVPENCLVFSFTPDIWFETNRSSVQINYLFGANASMSSGFSKYPCFVLDSGYWCTVPPNRDTVCKQVLSSYEVSQLASGSAGNGYEAAYYKLLNYAS